MLIHHPALLISLHAPSSAEKFLSVLKSNVDSPRTRQSAWSLGGTRETVVCQDITGTFSTSHQSLSVLQDNRDTDFAHRTALRIPPRSPFCLSNQAGWRIPRTEPSFKRAPPTCEQTRASTTELWHRISLQMASLDGKCRSVGINEWDSDSSEKLRFNIGELKDADNGLYGEETPGRGENTPEVLL